MPDSQSASVAYSIYFSCYIFAISVILLAPTTLSINFVTGQYIARAKIALWEYCVFSIIQPLIAVTLVVANIVLYEYNQAYNGVAIGLPWAIMHLIPIIINVYVYASLFKTNKQGCFVNYFLGIVLAAIMQAIYYYVTCTVAVMFWFFRMMSAGP